ncbi:QueT transporter family protein [Clostridium sp. CX1]|uniref:QueT transporter family protein n=1 Tax=Clostridium tanneri TaxID=3037988 RepID=A0ABU4JS24_9CLOT|nr:MULTISPECIES: QueT transporter family protein [unclassified Clostridium]MCT8978096.1 QueT transporter family protein [Clostridium sp. CX1]MDW8800947.1 QueT transporter family protein [Clostridium sp. A1-XYC3]
MNNSSKNIKKLVKIAITAAIYAVATVSIAPLSYGAVQFRFSEVMTLLAFIDPIYIPGLVLGCAISNLYSPLGIVDVLVGTTATLLAVYMIKKTKSLFIATLWPTIANGLIVGAELYFALNLPFLESALYVALGEFVVVTCIGYPLFKLLMKREDVMKVLKYQ